MNGTSRASFAKGRKGGNQKRKSVVCPKSLGRHTNLYVGGGKLSSREGIKNIRGRKRKKNEGRREGRTSFIRPRNGTEGEVKPEIRTEEFSGKKKETP